MSESPLKTRLSDAMKDAMRARDKERLGTIRLALSEIKRVEVDERIDPDDARILSILDKMVKQRRESIKQFSDGGRQELADKEQAEIDVLQEFMPSQLSEDELTKLIAAAIGQSGAESMKDMGKVMAILNPQLAGRADMAAVSKLIKAKLG
ncbi:MAG: GatB/YqeY domain-containing protein [Gammaproteobacteria bacterium]